MAPRRRLWRCSSLFFVAAANLAGPILAQQFDTHYVGYDAGSYPGFLQTVDVDADGSLDVVVCNELPPAGPAIAILRGNGRGQFAPPLHYPTALGPVYFIFRDFDGNDVMDLAVACRNDSTVSILLGTDPGVYQPPFDIRVPGTPTWLDAGDIDGDGHEDLVVTLRNRSVAILRGHSDGHFGFAGEVLLGSALAVAGLGDLDQDGDLDLAIGAGYNVFWRWNNGDGTFSPVQGYLTRLGNIPMTMMVRDLDGDGLLDILTLTGQGPCILLARFESFQVRQFEYATDYFTKPITLRLKDADGDGIDDLLAGQFVFFGRGNLDFEVAVAFKGVGTFVDAGDVDADGVQDLLGVRPADFYGHTGTLHVLRGRGERQFGMPEEWWWGTAAEPVDFIPADVNADGNLDVVVSGFRGEVVTVHLGDGQGRFGRGIDTRPGGWGPADIAVARLDEDPFPDLVVMNQWTYTLSIQAGRGDGTFVTANTLRGYHSSRFHLADFNADGLLDILPDVNNEYWRILLGQGNFAFRSVLQSGETSNLLDRLAQSKVADVNSDGFLDIIGIIPMDNRAAVLFGAADGRFTPGPVFGVSPGAKNCALGDLDENGELDLGICWWSDRTAMLDIWHGNGDGTFNRGGASTLDLVPGVLRFVDVDGDSHLDAVVRANYQYVTLLSGRGNGTFGPRINYGIQSLLHEIADWNGDGVQDLGVLDMGGSQFAVVPGRRLTPTPVIASLDVVHEAGPPLLLLRIDPGSLGRLTQVRLERGDVREGPYATISTVEPQTRIEFRDVDASDRAMWYRAALHGKKGDVLYVGPVQRTAVPFVTSLQPVADTADGSPIKIEYALRDQSFVDLRICDVRGRLLASLDRGLRGSGLHRIDWNREDARGVPAARGIYFLVLQARGESHVRRILFLHP